MGAGLQTYIDILGNVSGAVAAVASMKNLDATVQRSNDSVQALERSFDAAAIRARAFAASGDKAGFTKAAKEGIAIQDKIASAKQRADDAAQKRALFDEKLNARKADNAINAAKRQAKEVEKAQLAAEKFAKAEGFAAKAKEAGGPIGNLVGQFEKLASLGKVGVAIAIAAALLALSVAAIAATVALAKYALVASDAARSSQLLSAAATGSGSAGWELETVVDQLTNKIPQARQKTAEWARELALANIQGRDMQRTLTTMGTIASAVGDSGAAKIKGIAEASRNARVLMIGARDQFGEFAGLAGTGIKAADIYAAVAKSMRSSIPEAKRMVDAGIVPMRKGLEALELAAQTKFGPIVARQMMSLETQSAKLRENITRLFSGANIEKFLEGLKTVTDLFDTNSVMGYALREVFTSVFTKIADLASKAFPYVRAGVLGAALAVIMFATAAKRLYKQFQETFGGVSAKINGIQLAFQVGVSIVAAFVGSILALTAAFVLLGIVAVTATAPIWIPFALAALMIYGMVKAVSAVIDAFSSMGKTLAAIDLGKAAENIMNSLINGIKSKIADVKSAITDVGAAITGAFDTKMEIKSPSRVMTRRANYVMDPLVTVPAERASEVEQAITLAAPTGKNIAQMQGGGSGQTFAPQFTNCNFGTSKDDVTLAMEQWWAAKMLAASRGLAGAG